MGYLGNIFRRTYLREVGFLYDNISSLQVDGKIDATQMSSSLAFVYIFEHLLRDHALRFYKKFFYDLSNLDTKYSIPSIAVAKVVEAKANLVAKIVSAISSLVTPAR